MSDIPAEFLEKIQEAKDKQLEELNLCGRRLLIPILENNERLREQGIGNRE
ncbi:MAG: hypothetical protein QNJ54_01445 [Prochloraceae cyanobacterium]|nr:hypothetical protein [Prochloraceae cyanobacterium]